jgi:chromosomal replication initiator protein
VPEDLDTTWERVRAELRSEVTDFAFHIWLAPLSAAGMRGDTLYLRAPDHIRTWVEGRYMPLLAAATRRVLGDRANVEVVDRHWAEEGTASDELPGRVGNETGLNPRYTFEQFVIGDGNRLAHAAALTVAEQPGQAWNPLFIHGPPGLGKTHLLHAIGNYVQAYGLGLTVRYVTIEEFTAEFVQAVKNRETKPFRERFRSADVLLVDDTQFLADKVKTGEEFFHTFNALYEVGSQLVLTSDRPPAELLDLETRLQERFGCGLVAELEPPDFDVRLAILHTRARLDSLDGVGEDTLLEIARHVDGSVRSLESALIQVVAYASLRGEPPTPELARELLPRLAGRAPARGCNLDEIQEATAQAFGVSREALIAHDRRPQVALARQVAMYLARELTQETLPAIGRVFGGRNHSTVLHAHRRVARGLEGHDEAAVRLAELRQRLSRGG